MRAVILVVTIIMITAVQAQSGILNDKLDLSLGVRGRLLTGNTTYTIDFSEMYVYQGNTFVANYTSELEFPLDVSVTEVTVSLGAKLIKNLPWSLNVAYATNLNDPGNPMKDSDWLEMPSIDFDEKVIYSESNAALEADFLNIYAQAAV